MRKMGLITGIAFLLCCLLGASAFADGTMLRARVSGQLLGNYQTSMSGVSVNNDVSSGFSIGAELLFKVVPVLQLGAGAEYETGRSLTAYSSSAQFQFLPIYGVVRVPFELGPVTPYAIGRIGYGIFSGNSAFSGSISLNGGLYYALGGGVDLRFGQFAIFAEATYSADNGSYQYLGSTFNVLYTRMDLSAGVSIGL